MNILLNGVGRIGKSILRIADSCDDLNIVAINELNSNIDNIAYSINYDSTYGKFENRFMVDGDNIVNFKSRIKILNHENIREIDFKSLDIDYIIDASGAKVDLDILKALPVKGVFLTHPNVKADINIVMGVNEEKLDMDKHKIISTSSCNATALLPVLKILDDNFGIEYGDVTTIHPLLNHQKVLDNGCIASSDRNVECNFEFGRSSVLNIIPSHTTTITACSYVQEHINNDLISSCSFRVPTATVGAINLVVSLKKKTTKDDLIDLLKHKQNTQSHEILYNNFDPLVSSDFEKDLYTSIIDHRYTEVKHNKLVKLVLWYDNEWGYASKVLKIVSLFQ